MNNKIFISYLVVLGFKRSLEPLYPYIYAKDNLTVRVHMHTCKIIHKGDSVLYPSSRSACNFSDALKVICNIDK